jgi:hypothetical protein
MWQAEAVKVAFDAELWLWDARRAETWTFVSLPPGPSEEIRDLAGGLRLPSASAEDAGRACGDRGGERPSRGDQQV